MVRMLIVEPTAQLLTLLGEILGQEGFLVMDAANNYEGLSAAATALLGARIQDIWYLVIG